MDHRGFRAEDLDNYDGPLSPDYVLQEDLPVFVLEVCGRTVIGHVIVSDKELRV